MKVKDVGEFGLIKLLIEKVVRERKGPDNATPYNLHLLIDVGDDTAAWRCNDIIELYTTDTAVEGVHFTRTTTPWHDLGWKIMAANVSDIAAMGGLPLYALVTLGLPPDTQLAAIKQLYDGMLELGNRYGVSIVGGDIVRSPVFFVTVALTGVHDSQPLLRSAAKPGDVVAVTGFLGSSAGGLEIMLNDLPVAREAAEHLKLAHRRPEPCISQGRILSREGVRAAMDVSDGLLDDLSKLCQASGVGAQLEAEKVPIHPLLKQAFPQRHIQLALGGGEDYQLIFTAPTQLMGRVLPLLPLPATIIGKIVEGQPGQVVVLDSKGKKVVTSHGGWDHLRTYQ